MKSYVLALLLVVILFVAGCGAQKTQQESTEQISSEQTPETPVLDETTDVDAVEENLSPADSTEDDYGDII